MPTASMKPYTQLKTLTKNCPAEDWFYFAKDILGAKGAKSYIGVKKDDMERFAEELLGTNNQLYEVLPPGEPVHPYFDCEMEGVGDSQEQEHFIQQYRNWFTFQFEQEFGFKPEILTMNSSNDKKLSYHLVVTNATAENTAELKHYVHHLYSQLEQSELDDLKWKYKDSDDRLIIDKIPYGNNQCFRAVNQGKANSERTLRAAPETELLSTFARSNDKPNINLKRFKPEGDKKFKERVVKEYITDDDDMDDVEQAYKGEFMEYLNQNLLLKSSNGNWEDWRNMGFALYNTLGEKGLALFLQFSKQNTAKFNEKETIDFYTKIKPNTQTKITFKSIRYIARQANAKAAKKIFMMFIGRIEPRIYCTTDGDAADAVMDRLGDNLLYCGRWYMKVDNLWYCDTEKVRCKLMNEIMSAPIYRQTEKDEVQQWGNYAPAEKVYKTIITRTDESGFDKKLFHSTTKHRLCFKNGVLDFMTKKFYRWDEIDFPYYPVVQIPYDYEKATGTEELIEKVLEPIFGETTDLAIHYLSRSIAGCIEDKNFATYLGNRNCGKGALACLLDAFGEYVKPFNLGALCSDKMNNITSAKDMYWIMDLEFARLGISQEVPKDATLKADLIKKVCSGGDTINARRNYDRVDTEITPQCSLLMMGNDPIKGEGDVAQHRLEFEGCVEFVSQEQYVDLQKIYPERFMKKYRIADPKIKSKCEGKEWRLKMVQLLLDNFRDKPIKPAPQETDEPQVPLERFLADYIITDNKDDFVRIKELKDEYGSKLKSELTMMGLVYKKFSKKDHELHNCWGFIGIKRKDEE